MSDNSKFSSDGLAGGSPYMVEVAPLSPSTRSAWSKAWSAIPVTCLLLTLNAAVFLAMVACSAGQAFLSPSGILLVLFGADYGPLTLTGEYWRLLTNMFVHIGCVHILMNMYALWFVGESVERLYGSSKFLFLYLLSGVGGALCSLFFNPHILSAGASGAVFGAYGAMLAFIRVHARYYQPGVLSSVSRTIIVLLIYNLLFGLATPGIDNACHVGGFLTGLLGGVALAPAHPGLPPQRVWRIRDLFWMVVIAVLLYGLFDLDKINLINSSH